MNDLPSPVPDRDDPHIPMQGIQFPLVQPASRLSRAIKIALGGLLGLLRPAQRAALIRGEPGRDHLRLDDRLIIAALVWQHRRRGTLGALHGLHRWLWRGEQAARVHTQAEPRFRAWWQEHNSAVIAPLAQAMQELAAAGTPIKTLCEIGCGTGSVLADVARRLPDLDHLIGLDLSPGQIAATRARHADQPRLRFEVADANTWLIDHAAPRWAYLANGGVLEYFSEAMLEALFTGIAQRHAPALFALVEPIAEDYDLDRETMSRPYNEELSLSHNYAHWLRRSGWRVLDQQRQTVGGVHWLRLVAVTGQPDPA